MAPPTARFQFAPDDPALEPDPTWWDIDDFSDQMRVADYTIDRGRAFELDKVDVGRATINLHDQEGNFDPTNIFGPWGDSDESAMRLQPLKQARLAVWDPVREDWFTRFKGFIEAFENEYDASQRVNRVTITLVDLFEIVSAVQMFPGNFGDPPPSDDVVFMESTPDGDLHGMKIRVEDILGETGVSDFSLGSVGLPAAFYDVFSGNVSLHEGVYSAGQSAMDAIMETVDAEFPGVGNVYADRLGVLAVHGRFARFDPVTTSAATGWDFHDWKAGDGAAVLASPTDTAHLRTFAMSRDLSKVVNVASASPKSEDPAADFTTQVVVDNTSKGLYGIRAWSTDGLLTKEGVTDGLTGDGADWEECRRFAQYYVDNYKVPRNRVQQVTFRSMPVGQTGAGANWELLSECDLNDRVALTISGPGGGGMEHDGAHPTYNQFFIEGIHEEHKPLNDTMDDVTLTLDLSPARYFDQSPFGT